MKQAAWKRPIAALSGGVLGFAWLLLAACGGGSAPAAPTPVPAPAAENPVAGGRVVVGVTADIGSINPYSTLSTTVTQEIASVLFRQLLRENPDYTDHPPTFGPDLAESWEISPDGLTVTFHLQKDALWSDGTPIDAEDIRYTWQAQTNPEVAWDSSQFKRFIRDVEVVDKATVKFHLSRRTANPLLQINEGQILPRHLWSQLPFARWHSNDDWFVEHLATSGPYTVESWARQQELVLAPNPHFRSPHPPYLDKVVIRVVPEVSSLVAEFLADNLDVVFGITPSDVKRIEAQPSLGVVSWLSRSFAFVAWNTRRELFHSPAARRALTLAIDRESLVEAIYGRYGKLSNSLIISDVWAYDRSLKPWPYDPAKAREILAAEGFRDIDGDGILDRGGKPFRFELATNSGNPQRQDALILIQQQLRKVGVDAQLRFVAFNPLMEQADRGEFDALLARWTMPTDLDLSFALATESIGRAQNIFGYSSPQMDRLLEKTRNAATLEEFHQGLLEVQQLVHQDLPLTLLYEAHDLGAYHRRVHGLQPNALRRFWQIEDWWRSP